MNDCEISQARDGNRQRWCYAHSAIVREGATRCRAANDDAAETTSR